MMERKILRVPRIEQLPGGYCGVACLNMVLAYLGFQIDQEDLAQYFLKPKKIEKEGIHWNEIPIAAKKLGFEAQDFHSMTLEDIVKHIDNKTPIIARGRTNPIFEDCGHFRVIRGYDLNIPFVYFHDPGAGKPYSDIKGYPYEFFKQIWSVGSISSINSELHFSENYGIIIKDTGKT